MKKYIKAIIRMIRIKLEKVALEEDAPNVKKSKMFTIISIPFKNFHIQL